MDNSFLKTQVHYAKAEAALPPGVVRTRDIEWAPKAEDRKNLPLTFNRLTDAEVQHLYDLLGQITPGTWGVTTYAGGVSFNGLKRIHGATNPDFGEPYPVLGGYFDADFEFIPLVRNRLKDLLTELLQLRFGITVLKKAFLDINGYVPGFGPGRINNRRYRELAELRDLIEATQWPLT